MPPFPHRFQVPVTLVPTVQPFCPASLVSLARALSPQVTVYRAWVLTKHIQLWNQDSLSYGYGVRVVQTTLSARFRSTITGVVVLGFRSSSVAVAHEGYFVESRRPLWFGSSQANCSVFNTLSTPRWRQFQEAR